MVATGNRKGAYPWTRDVVGQYLQAIRKNNTSEKKIRIVSNGLHAPRGLNAAFISAQTELP
jgi:hypothetical protein